MKTLLSLFDYSGQWSAPFADAGWTVVQVDIKHGHDIKKFISAAADEIVGDPPAGVDVSYVSGFLRRRLPEIRLEAWG